MQQIFVDFKVKCNEEFSLQNDQFHHLKNVLRMKENEVLRVVDIDKRKYSAKITDDFKFICFEEIMHCTDRKYDVTLLVGLLKKEKWDFILQKSTELGVTNIVPFESMRTIVKSKDEKADKKIERWNKIVLEAANQCKRDSIPNIHPVISLKDANKFCNKQNFVAYENDNITGVKLKDCLENSSVTVVIGPEGGFDVLEIKMLNEYGFKCISLGKRILRAETAVIYALSSIDALIE